ncbi:MAG: excinuclease ABC subunit UvrC [bacterium]
MTPPPAARRATPRAIRETLKRLPIGPGVYLMRDAAAVILYVGKARNLRSRVRSYFHARAASPKVAALVERAESIETIVTGNEVEALLLEMNLIKEHRPRYNVMLRDDKKFPFLKITVNELYPRLLHTRNVKADGGRYFGPYTDAKAMRRAESTIRTVFPIRSCRYTFPTKQNVRVCLDYHLKKCPGPCESLISPDAYREMISGAIAFLEGRGDEAQERLRAEMNAASSEQRYEMAAFYRDQLRALEKVAERQRVSSEGGEDRDFYAIARRGIDAVVALLKVRGGRVIGRESFELRVAPVDEDAEILESVVKRVYANATFIPEEISAPLPIDDEGAIAAWLRARRGSRVEIRCPSRGERVALLELARKNAESLLTDRVLRKTGRGAELSTALLALQQALGLSRYPMRIDCLDISHVQGSDPVGASVSFVGGKPSKALYRRYRIRGGFGNDDFASMREVVERKARRAREGGDELPDLLVIDGGKGQLSSALESLAAAGVSDLPVIALAKEQEEIYMPARRAALRLPPSPPLKLLQRLRDETHRFAVTYHRKRRTARVIATELTGIPGVGPAIARRVLEAFGSVDGARAAGAEKLAAIPGVGRRVAEQIAASLAGTVTARADAVAPADDAMRAPDAATRAPDDTLRTSRDRATPANEGPSAPDDRGEAPK